MNKKHIKFLSCVLALVLITGITVPISFSAVPVDDPDHYSDIPVIYVAGEASDALIIDNGTDEPEYIHPIELPENYISQFLTQENLKMFIKCYYSNNYDEFCNLLYDAYLPVYEKLTLNTQGQPDNGSHHKHTSQVYPDIKDNKFKITHHKFYYDFRKDPCEIADELEKYISAVCRSTNKNKVCLLGRCLGSNEILAYLDEYGTDKVSDVILYSSAADGCEPVSHLFSGTAFVDNNALTNYAQDFDYSLFTNDETLIEFIKAFITAYNKIGGVKLALNEVNRVYGIVKNKVTPTLLKGSYGTWPGYWSMVDDENYEKAKELIFGDDDDWAEFIRIIDNYHYNIGLKSDEILKKCADNGVDVYNIEKYGIAMIPVVKEYDVISDGMVELGKSSKGATTVKINETFNKKYLTQAAEKGTAKYISPDKQVDASTCLFPDTTFFIKNLDHGDFPFVFNELISYMASEGTFTVFEDENWPQYIVYNKEDDTASPMTAENSNTTEKWNTSFFDAFKIVFKDFKYVFNLIKSLLG
ncbi:MAG: hypothetical protein IJM10_00480 [Clostridia bacterium]|nr:hypothetical protein [Clostridia bacterium]